VRQSATVPDGPERWLPVAEFPHYQVSDFGRLRSLDRTILCADRWGGTAFRHYRGRILKPQPGTSGYQFVMLYRDQVPYDRMIHTLVAEAFLGPRPEGMQVCHGPNGKHDNRASELRYDTPAGNMADCLRDGTDSRGSKSANAKLTEADVIDIRNRASTGGWGIQDQLAKEYGVSWANISQIIRRKTWKHIA
jgi:NUMOD4 motif/HNH endonuclease